MGGEHLGVRIARGDRQEPEFVDRNHAQACQTLLTRIVELHIADRSAEEIATQVLTTEPENAMFRAAMLVEIILEYSRRCPEEENQ
ncbi:MAG: hypothetical protein LAO07_19375 [Acidobacteriia bacterium]|nr:hypothetical protein [Terriglobia bacterium]